ncbi:hypothetical protein LA66_13900 [Aureimonas altamirensis]|uniref:DUF7939 domain-containing protein n=1 Tax=Aureimonas altamirensis TaxID=370622 RepID=A0A0B1Q6Q6_9HYPH|nr:BatD family protein [Aureimonas altamirensis]KHJ54525.1 hypothetical protein LA66_13900 [Aureimonas altamirensis]
MKFAAVALTMALTSVTHFAAAAGPSIEASFDDGPQPVAPGRQLHLTVRVIAPNYFMSGVEFPDLDTPDAIVTLSRQRAINSTRTIDGQRFAVVAKTYLVTPLAAGTLTLPSAQISIDYAAEPGRATASTLHLPPISIDVPPLAGGAANGTVVPVADMAISQSVEPQGEALKRLMVGDVVTRTITITATGARAMLIPPVDVDAPDGVRVYEDEPTVVDTSSGGTRTQVFHYALEKPGIIEIPPVEIPVRLADSPSRMGSARVEGFEVSVAPPVAAILPPPDANDTPTGVRWWRFGSLAVLSALALALLVRPVRAVGHMTNAWFARRQAERSSSEAAAFSRLRSAMRSGSAGATYAALSGWTAQKGFLTIGEWVDSTKDERLRVSIRRLERSLFSAAKQNTPAVDRQLSRAITAARFADRRIVVRHERGVLHKPLPPLNPDFRGR